MQNLNAVTQQTVDIARNAGQMILDHFGKPIQIDHKSVHDVVTEADKAVENYIIPTLLDAYPTHHFVGEEGSSLGAPYEEAEYRWYIDPIDGTTNFAGNIPHFCTSIALADKDNQPLLGVVYDPNRDEMYVAQRGMGATCNDEPLHVNEIDDLDYAVIGTGFPHDRSDGMSNNFRQFAYFAPRVRGVRRFGSAALDLCWVASGRLDAYWEWNLSRWDFFAGWLMITEAGGKMSDYQGDTGDTLNTGAQVLAATSALHPAMLKGMQDALEFTI
jgi:myo-inositol-1(or 4)-monophosphatase